MKLFNKNKSYSVLLISCILIILFSNLNSPILFFRSDQIEVEFLDIRNSNKIFDGMYINYTFTFGEANPSQISYTNISDTEFHVDWIVYESGSVSHGYWDVNAQTRVIANSGGGGFHFGDGYHTPIWIITNVSIDDQILIVVDGEGDHLFEVTSELIYEIPDIGPVEVWVLEDLNVSGGVAWYEKSTGILLDGLFYFDEGNNNYKFEFLNTNAEFNFTQDYELGVSLEIPTFCELEVTHQINATVTNYGVKDVFNINLSLYLDGITVISNIISNLPAGSNEIIIYYWTPIEYGAYNFTVYTPPLPDESFLDNNYATEIIPLHRIHLFDGMCINYTAINGGENPSQFYYYYISGNKFHVDWFLDDSGSISHMYWDVDAQTRVMENSGGNSLQFGNGYHTPIWIITDVLIGDQIHIAVDGEGDHLFEVTSELIYEIPDIGPVEVWVLEDLNVSGGVAWYEKSTGILLNGSFYYGGGAANYKFEFVNTNAEFNFTHDYELGVSLKVLQIPILLGIGKKIQINTTISNYGLKDVFNINLSLYLDSNILNSIIIANLPSGSSETITYYWTPSEYGVYNFTAYVPPFQEEPYLDNNYATKIIHLPPTRLFDGMYIQGRVFDFWDIPYISNVSYFYSSDNIFYVDWDINLGQYSDFWSVDLTTREISGSYYFDYLTHTPFWIYIDVSLGDIVLIAFPEENDHEFEVLNELIYDLPRYGPVEVWVLQDLTNPNGIAWYEKSTGILLNGTFLSVDGISYLIFDFFESNARFSYVYPPNSFELNTDAGTPSDSDGMFELMWTVADGALAYDVYEYSSQITVINDTLTTLIKNTTDLQLNLDGYSDGTYYFIVVAYNNYGERKSNCIKVNIEIPQLPEPFNLNTDADTPSDSDGEFKLFWTESNNANNYSVYQYSRYITEINGSLTLLSEEITDREFLISGYNNGEYYFIVIAKNNDGTILSNCINVNVVISTSSNPASISGYPVYFIGITCIVVISILFKKKLRVRLIS